jgi:hypothetical protein
VNTDQTSGRHVTDEDLLLDYYGESTLESRSETRAHLETCQACRAVDRELRAVLALVDSEPVPEAPPGFERDMWARLEPQIAARAPRTRSWWMFPPQWALAAGVAALLVAAFALGRVSNREPVSPPPPSSASNATSLAERLVRNEVEDHFERSQRVLVELVNADDSGSAAWPVDRAHAADLVAAGRLYRQSVEEIGDTDTRDLLEDVERVLVEVANESPDASSNDLSGVRTRISDQDLIFRLRMATAEMRERERRAQPTW